MRRGNPGKSADGRRRGHPGASPTGENRRGVEINLAPSAIDKGRRIALLRGESLSGLVERLILALPDPPSSIIV